VLNRLGYTVHIPPGQCCCGGIARQQGDAETSREMLEQNVRAFSALSDLPLLTTVSGCGMGLRDHMGKQVSDISTFLANADWRNVTLAPLNAIIHVHDACSLRNAMRQHKGVYDLLRRIPQADIQPLPGNDQCCGGAGSYMLTQPKMARALLDDKIEACLEAETRLLVTTNIGCALQIDAGLREEGMKIEVIHPVQLIARQMGFSKGNV
jgi:glycolate oxidase iron-sulfur subunit